MSIVFEPKRLENPISVEGIHGTPINSKVRLDGYGHISICNVYVPVYKSEYLSQSVVSDGVLMDQGFQAQKSKGKVEIRPPGAQDTWYSLSLDPDGRAYIGCDLIRRPPQVSIFSLRDTSISREIWHAHLRHFNEI